ncbi:DNA polymerase III subunit delta (plasmid) [Calothrix sp. NIES-4071]|nr:DNA polymerase III subunit delta [Calothrix sp. NIES-4071]BAZ64592.1 DNA polymerase III subunit delta [Calothrix sp. NIES-4105]
MRVYILYGDDQFNMKRRVEEIKSTLDNEVLNYHLLPDDSNAQAVVNELLTPPLMGDSKIIHVSNDCLFKDADNTKKIIKGKLEMAPSGNILLITTSKKPASNTVVVKELLKYGKMQEFLRISEWNTRELSTYIKDAAIMKGFNLSNEAIQYLVENIGTNSELINSELTKIKLYVGDKDNVEIEALQELVSNNYSNSIQLAKYCLDGKTEDAYSKLNQLENTHPLQITAALQTCFRTWVAVKAGIIENKSDVEIASIANVYNPSRIYFLKQEVRSCSLLRLRNILAVLVKLEYELKTGASNNSLITRIVEMTKLSNEHII